MKGEEEQNLSSFSRAQEEEAGIWVARHERGLTEEEAQQFEQWLSENPSNEACYFESQVAWASFDVMDEWKPSRSSAPNPDLFEVKPKSRWSRFAPLGGLAAALLLGLYLFQLSLPGPDGVSDLTAVAYKSQSNEKHFLEDGSSFYLLPGSEVRVTYSDAERTIELISGEVEFTVAHRPDQPFVVHSEIGSVTALGTVFTVKQDTDAWEVFVTEGRVKVDQAKPAPSVALEQSMFSAELIAGQKLVEALSDSQFAPKIESFTESEMNERLAWKDQIIDMVSAPLEEILIEFERFNRREVLIEDEELKRMRMTVAIKPDNLEDFIDLLELAAGVEATDTESGAILLSRSAN